MVRSRKEFRVLTPGGGLESEADRGVGGGGGDGQGEEAGVDVAELDVELGEEEGVADDDDGDDGGGVRGPVAPGTTASLRSLVIFSL